MGKTTRLGMMLVLFFVIGAAVLMDKDEEKGDGKTAGTPDLNTAKETASTPWGHFMTEPEDARTPASAIPDVVPDGHGARPRAGSSVAERPGERSAAVSNETSRGIAARTYRIESGDTLERISNKVYGSRSHWRKILAANPDKLPNERATLRVGMDIAIPALAEGGTAAPVSAARSPSAPAESPRPSGRVAASAPAAGTVENGKVYHVVQKGERLWDIAGRYYGSGVYWRTIVSLNPDKITDGQSVKTGTRILIGDRSKLQRGE